MLPFHRILLSSIEIAFFDFQMWPSKIPTAFPKVVFTSRSKVIFFSGIYLLQFGL